MVGEFKTRSLKYFVNACVGWFFWIGDEGVIHPSHLCQALLKIAAKCGGF
jgi:hypothetical protein